VRVELVIDDKTMTAAYIGRTARIYREAFHSDLLLDISEASSKFFAALGEIGQMENGPDITNPAVLGGVVAQSTTPEFLEKIVWACLFAENPGMKQYTSWLDSIEDYPTLMMSGTLLFQHMIGNTTTVEPEDDGSTNTNSKKKSLGQKSQSRPKKQGSHTTK
jgi:hypothetical protein